MNRSQAFRWLIAGVLAAGLNASYHDGGLQWAHRVADRVEESSAAALAMSGRAGQFFSEVRMLTTRDHSASTPWETTLAQVQTNVAHSQREFDRFEVMAARQRVQLAKLEANRSRMEAEMALRTTGLGMTAANFVAVKTPQVSVICPRVRVKIPQLPRVKIPAIPIIDVPGVGPI